MVTSTLGEAACPIMINHHQFSNAEVVNTKILKKIRSSWNSLGKEQVPAQCQPRRLLHLGTVTFGIVEMSQVWMKSPFGCSERRSYNDS